MRLNIIVNGQGPEPENKMYTSGGTTRLIEIMKRLSKKQDVVLKIVSSKTVCSMLKNAEIKANYYVVPRFIKGNTFFKLFLDSILRAIYVCLSSASFANDNALIYSPSDFLWDTLPAFVGN